MPSYKTGDVRLSYTLGGDIAVEVIGAVSSRRIGTLRGLTKAEVSTYLEHVKRAEAQAARAAAKLMQEGLDGVTFYRNKARALITSLGIPNQHQEALLELVTEMCGRRTPKGFWKEE